MLDDKKKYEDELKSVEFLLSHTKNQIVPYLTRCGVDVNVVTNLTNMILITIQLEIQRNQLETKLGIQR